MANVERVYTAEEVAQHNTEKDLWMTIHGHAYALTKFLKEHPGGEEVLTNLAGQEATMCFDEIGHSQEAIQLRDTFRVGRVTGNSLLSVAGQTSSSASATIDDDDWEYEEPKKETSLYLRIFIAIGVAVYAFVFYYIFSS